MLQLCYCEDASMACALQNTLRDNWLKIHERLKIRELGTPNYHYLPQYEPIPQGVVGVDKQLAAPVYVGGSGYLRNDGLVRTKFRDLDDLPREAGS